jgi:hypothetical protein
VISRPNARLRHPRPWPDEYELSADTWRVRALDPPEPLLGEMLTNTTRAFIGAPTGIGKTQLVNAMAMGLVSGSGFLHWRAFRPCRVLIVDGEMPRDLMKERLQDAIHRQDGPWSPRDLFLLNSEDAEDLAARFPALGMWSPLNTEAGQTYVLKLTEILKPDVVFFDNRMSVLCGDMKDELPWTETMPLVKALTAARIAQVWIDHTGHDGGHIYGSKTKEWSFDVVALLRPVENAEADVSFIMEFTKARRRKPSNRIDFAPVTITLQGDQWSGVLSSGCRTGPKPLTERLRGWLSDITDVFASIEAVERAPMESMKPILTLTRAQVRDGLRVRGRFEADAHAPLTPKDRTALRDALYALKDRGKIGMTEALVWLA